MFFFYIRQNVFRNFRNKEFLKIVFSELGGGLIRENLYCLKTFLKTLSWCCKIGKTLLSSNLLHGIDSYCDVLDTIS